MQGAGAYDRIPPDAPEGDSVYFQTTINSGDQIVDEHADDNNRGGGQSDKASNQHLGKICSGKASAKAGITGKIRTQLTP